MFFGFNFNLDPYFVMIVVRRWVTLMAPSYLVTIFAQACQVDWLQGWLWVVRDILNLGVYLIFLVILAWVWARAFRITGIPPHSAIDFWLRYRLFRVLDWPWIRWFKDSE